MASDPAPDAPGADAAALHRHELLLGRALVASGSAAKRAEAEGRLLAFLGTARLPAPAAAHATVLLGECRILLEDAWGALAALEPELPAEAGETLRRRREILVEDAKRLASADRAKAFELADRLAAADVSAAPELAAMGSRAARPLREALLHADEPLRIRRLLAAAEAFGAPKADLTDASTRDQWQDSVRKACEKLESVPRPASKSPDR
ncbi:MAG: hypothetical protein HMLKMBBP_03917 [Planctomycetes bacterium]|nr:hypothetical protein [Planctomycetota bacterium]